VLWNINPLVAHWISSTSNFLFTDQLLRSDSIVLELGAGISPLIGLCLSPYIGRYLWTDQDYVLKTLRQNVEMNARSSTAKSTKLKQQPRKSHGKEQPVYERSCIDVVALDWETSDVRSILGVTSLAPSVLIGVDCVFNPAIIKPFVSTLAEMSTLVEDDQGPVLTIVAQQLRSPDVFSEWLEVMLERFRVWRICKEALTLGAQAEDTKMTVEQGYTVHVCILKDT